MLRGRWYHITVLNVHAPTEDKTDDVKDSFYGELERVFDKFPKYHTNIFLGDFNAEVGRVLTSPDIKTHSQTDHILKDRRRHSNVLDVRSFMAADGDSDHYLVVGKVRERLAVNNQGSQRFDMERFNRKKLNEVKVKSNFVLRSQISLQLWKILTQRWKLVVAGKRFERI
jgi:hypothetical protein